MIVAARPRREEDARAPVVADVDAAPVLQAPEDELYPFAAYSAELVALDR